MSSSFWIVMGPAFCAGLLVMLAHVPLGQEVLKRGIIFIDLAIAQIAALGLVAVRILAGEEASPLLMHGVALLCAVSAAWCFHRTEKRFPQLQEGLIGSSFVVASSLALLMLARDPHGGEAAETMLAGQILWVSWKQVAVAGAVYGTVLALWFLKPQYRRWFYYLFAVTVTVSVQLVGVYLVFASLILPALAAAGFPEKYRLRAGYAIALVALASGLVLSILVDLPTGPVLVCALAATSLAGGMIHNACFSKEV